MCWGEGNVTVKCTKHLSQAARHGTAATKPRLVRHSQAHRSSSLGPAMTAGRAKPGQALQQMAFVLHPKQLSLAKKGVWAKDRDKSQSSVGSDPSW